MSHFTRTPRDSGPRVSYNKYKTPAPPPPEDAQASYRKFLTTRETLRRTFELLLGKERT